MRKLTIMASLLMASIIFTACEDDDSPNDPSPTQAQQTEAAITSGLWAITSFIDDNEDETSDYTGWSFNFVANGTLLASQGNSAYTGTWLTKVDDGQAELWINLQGPEFIQELNEDWKIVSQSATELKLEDDDDPFTDELIFTQL